MRKNKFKVWCKDRNEWEKDLCVLGQDGVVYRIRRSGQLVPLRPEAHIPVFLIGKKDDNDVEIYEGDIIRLTEEAQWGKSGQEQPTEDFVVEYVTAEVGFQFDHSSSLRNLGGHHIALLLNIGKGKVIGNIYENPEMHSLETKEQGVKSNEDCKSKENRPIDNHLS